MKSKEARGEKDRDSQDVFVADDLRNRKPCFANDWRQSLVPFVLVIQMTTLFLRPCFMQKQIMWVGDNFVVQFKIHSGAII